MLKYLKILAELTKIRITFFVTITTGFGYIAFSGKFDPQMIFVVLGILLLACGSAALNHYQERSTDALMDRTRNRPIPSGSISARGALGISLILVLTGSLFLIFGSGLLAFVLGFINLIWYNGIYTPLKKITSLAIIPGSLVGAIPPITGWVAAGGNLLDPQIIIIGFFFLIWQIPHFWLLLIVLDKDYQKAGFPTLTNIFNREQLARITFIWIVATAVTSLLIPLFDIVEISIINYILFAAVVLLTLSTIKLLNRIEENILFKFAFRNINLFVLFVVSLISIEKLIL